MADPLSIARPYAKAAFEVATEMGNPAEWSFVLKKLALASQDSAMQAVLKNPSILSTTCYEMLSAFVGNEQQKHLLKLLAENNRLIFLPEISAVFETLLAKAAGYLSLVVTTAKPLGDVEQKQMDAKLSKQLGSALQIEFDVDPALLGGFIAKSNDWVMDASILGRLKKLEPSLI